IPQDVAKEGKDYLLEHGYEIKMGYGITIEQLIKDVEDCDAVLVRTAPFTKEVLSAGKKLKIIARHGVGYDNVDVKAAAELGIWATNAPMSNANAVAEHTIGLIIACAKNYTRCERAFRNGNFEIRNQLNGYDLEGKTLGIIGVGRIGSMVAKKAALGLGMKVIGYDPYMTPSKVIPEVEMVKDWESVFENADFVTLHIPAVEETKGIVGKKEFEMMKSTAYFVNCARGEIIKEADLIEALKEKKIAGAALDVYEKEPPAQDNALFGLENVILTPHNASLTVESAARMALHAAMEIHEVLSGKEPNWPVNSPKFINP
ncbi:MAG: phosphoglycerate dehydrogenase, partial [Clostridiales bacterium]|nr:phosphoglycerate dehydrogenase [Clostridiales bacterium]